MMLTLLPITALAVDRDPSKNYISITTYEDLKRILGGSSGYDFMEYRLRLDCDIIQEDNVNLNSLVCGRDSYVLDLNGHTLMRTAKNTTDTALFQVGETRGLRVFDSVGGGKVIVNMAGTDRRTAVFGVSGQNSPLTIEGGYFESLNGPAIQTYGGKTDIRGGTFRGYRYTVNQTYGDITFNGGTFLEPEGEPNNTSTCYMSASEATFTVNAAVVYGDLVPAGLEGANRVGQHLGAETHVFEDGVDTTEACLEAYAAVGHPVVFGKAGTEMLTAAYAQIPDPIPGKYATEVPAVSGDSAKYDVHVNWFDVEDGSEVYGPYFFYIGRVYRPIVSFEPKEGYVFTADTTLYVNGRKYAADGSLDKPVVSDITIMAKSALNRVTGTYQKPVIGATPSFDVNVSSDSNYTACIESWEDITTKRTYTLENVGDYKFQAGHQYTATVKVTPKEGYIVDLFTTYNINGDNNLKKTYTLPNAITKVEIDITEPSIGEKPNFEAHTANDAMYRVSEFQWFDYNTQEEMSDDDVFVAGGQYIVKVRVTPTADNFFADKYAVYLNDYDATKVSSLSEKTGEILFFYLFDELKEANIEITNLDIKVSNPVIGGHLDFNVPVLSHINSKAEGTSVKWYQYDSPYQQVGADHVIDKDMRYAYQATFYTEDGYQFADNVTVTLNGNPLTKTNMKAMFSVLKNYVGSEYCSNQMSVYYVFTPTVKEENTLLSSPIISSLTNTANGVQVTWGAVSGASKYRVFYRIGSGAWVTVDDVTGTSKEVTGLTSGTTYTFYVRCVSADGKTFLNPYDSSKAKSIAYTATLASPVISSLSNTANGVQVTWGAVSGASKYRVFYRIGSGSWVTVGDVTGTSKEVTGLTSGTTYTFYVRCVSADGKTFLNPYDGSKTKSITYTATLASPVISSLSNTANGVQVTWGAVSGASKYRVFYRIGSGSWVTVGDVTGTSKEVTGLTSGTAYTFYVRCVSEDGKTYTSPYDGSKTKSITYNATVASPVISSLTNTANGVQVTWGAVSGASKYRVFYREGSGAWVSAADVTGTSAVVTGLTSGKTYTFFVRCISADGKTYTSPYDLTKSKNYTYSATLAAPVISSLSSTATGVEVKWGAVSGAAKYRVFYRIGSGAWITAADVTGTSTVVTGLTSGTTYSFFVRCISADGKTYTSPYDAAKIKNVTYTTSLATPVLTGVSNTTGGVQVTWNAVAGAAKYRVFYRIGSGAWTSATDTTGTSVVVNGLAKGTTYRFTVRCLSADGKTYTSSYDATGKTITVN